MGRVAAMPNRRWRVAQPGDRSEKLSLPLRAPCAGRTEGDIGAENAACQRAHGDAQCEIAQRGADARTQRDAQCDETALAHGQNVERLCVSRNDGCRHFYQYPIEGA